MLATTIASRKAKPSKHCRWTYDVTWHHWTEIDCQTTHMCLLPPTGRSAVFSQAHAHGLIWVLLCCAMRSTSMHTPSLAWRSLHSLCLLCRDGIWKEEETIASSLFRLVWLTVDDYYSSYTTELWIRTYVWWWWSQSGAVEPPQCRA